MTPEQRIAEIRQRVEKATPGPWFTGPHYKADVHSRKGVIRANCWSAPQAIADAEFIAQAREDMPYLLAALAQSEAARQQAEQAVDDMHQFGKDWQRQALASEAKVAALSDALRALLEACRSARQIIRRDYPDDSLANGNWPGIKSQLKIVDAAITKAKALLEAKPDQP